MPDFWDKLFKLNLGIDDPSYAIHAVTSVILLYAQDEMTKPEIVATLVDSAGATMTPAEQQQAVIMTDAIDAQTHADPIVERAAKVNRALRINAAAMLAELGQIDKATAKSLAGV